jgi:hypothetical protein
MTVEETGTAPYASRTPEQRRRDTMHRLEHDVDCWVATASIEGEPFLVPLSFDWDGEALLLATLAQSPTGRNLSASQSVRIGLGDTRDVTMIDGTVEILPIGTLSAAQGDRFAARAGFDPRTLGSRYCWFRVTPRRIQAWREENELSGRELMRDGRWLVDRT